MLFHILQLNQGGNLYGPSFAITKKDDKRKQIAVWLWPKEFLKPANQAEFVRLTGYVPVRMSALDLLKDYRSKSIIVSSKISNVDVFSLVSNSHTAVVNYLSIINGSIVLSHIMEFKKRLSEKDEEIKLHGFSAFILFIFVLVFVFLLFLDAHF